MSLTLPLADADDIPAMMTIMATAFDPSFGEAWSQAQLAGSLGMQGAWARLARTDEALIGFSLCRRIGDEAELLLIAVGPLHRGGPAARTLLAQSMADALAEGASTMFLEVREDNAPARRLYARHDFIAVGRRRDYYSGRGGRRFDAITMRRVLADLKLRRAMI